LRTDEGVVNIAFPGEGIEQVLGLISQSACWVEQVIHNVLVEWTVRVDDCKLSGKSAEDPIGEQTVEGGIAGDERRRVEVVERCEVQPSGAAAMERLVGRCQAVSADALDDVFEEGIPTAEAVAITQAALRRFRYPSVQPGSASPLNSSCVNPVGSVGQWIVVHVAVVVQFCVLEGEGLVGSGHRKRPGFSRTCR
jgi:hypothetical protein